MGGRVEAGYLDQYSIDHPGLDGVVDESYCLQRAVGLLGLEGWEEGEA